MHNVYRSKTSLINSVCGDPKPRNNILWVCSALRSKIKGNRQKKRICYKLAASKRQSIKEKAMDTEK